MFFPESKKIVDDDGQCNDILFCCVAMLPYLDRALHRTDCSTFEVKQIQVTDHALKTLSNVFCCCCYRIYR